MYIYMDVCVNTQLSIYLNVCTLSSETDSARPRATAPTPIFYTHASPRVNPPLIINKHLAHKTHT